MDLKKLSKLPNGVYAISKRDGTILNYTLAYEESHNFRNNFDIIAVDNGVVKKINKPIKNINEVFTINTKKDDVEILNLNEDVKEPENLTVSEDVFEKLTKKAKKV